MSSSDTMGASSAELADAGLPELGRPGSILARTAHGAAWVIGWRMATRLLGVISTLILVRLLAPADFGLVALGYGFVSSLDQLCTIGIETAIIRDDRPDRDLYDTGFTLNLLRAIGMGAALAAGASAIASFLGDRRLEDIVLVFAAMTALSGLNNIGVVDFRRYIAFDKEFRLQIVPRILSVAVTISIAVIFRSYWALVAGIVFSSLFTVLFGYWMHPYRPRLTLRAWRRLAGFSVWMWVLGVITMLRNQMPNLVVGRVMGPGPVGILGVGNEVANLPLTELVAPLSRASFSGFAAARQSDEGNGETFLRILAAMALITLPAGFGISLVAFPVVRLAYGATWVQAVPLVEVLGVAGTLTLFGFVSSTLFAAHAWLRPIANISGTTTIACVLLLIALVPYFGLLGAAIAIALTDAFNQVIFLVATLRRLGLRMSDLLSRLWRCLFATAVMTLVLVLLGLGWNDFPGAASALAVRLLLAVVLGAGVYVVIVVGTWLAAGRPAGAEADVVALLGRVAGKLTIRRRRA